MLIRYMFDNFCSFKEECEFSLEAPGGKVKKRFPDNYITTETGYDLLKTAVIVGENAGGKSNFINGLKYLKSLFDTNMKVQSVNSYINADTLMECNNPKQKFNVVFLAGNHNRNLLGGLYRENPVKSRNYEAVKSSKKWENVGNSYIIPALLLYRYSYI